jgi:universal stress protein A
MTFAPKKILLATDFSPQAAVAADAAADLASVFNGSLILVYVVPFSTYVDFAEGLGKNTGWDADVQATVTTNARDRLEKEAARLSKKGAQVRTLIADGPPQLEIAELARKEGVDLVIVGSHGRTGLKHVVIGSVAEGVVRHCQCPVLVIRSRE